MIWSRQGEGRKDSKAPTPDRTESHFGWVGLMSASRAVSGLAGLGRRLGLAPSPPGILGRISSSAPVSLRVQSRPYLLEAGPAALASLHEASGLPWWATISGVTVGLRLALLPFTLKQRQALSALQIVTKEVRGRRDAGGEAAEGEGSLQVWSEAARLWTRRARTEAGFVGPVWLFTPIFAHLPCFVAMMLTVRHMASTPTYGFDSGGALWFRDLTLPAFELASYTAPMGPAGAILPGTLVLLYHYSIQQTFSHPRDKPASESTATDLVLRTFLEWLTIPLLLVGLQVPHGIFCYWLTSSLFNIAQVPILRSQLARDLLAPQRPATTGSAMTDEPPAAAEAAMASSYLFERARELSDSGKGASVFVLDKDGLERLDYGEAMSFGRTFAKKQDWGQAHKMFLVSATKAGATDSREYTQAIFWAAMAAARLDLDRDARDLLSKVLEKDPKNTESMLAMASLHKKVRESSARLLTIFVPSLVRLPASAASDELTSTPMLSPPCPIQNNETEDARKWLVRASEIDPKVREQFLDPFDEDNASSKD